MELNYFSARFRTDIERLFEFPSLNRSENRSWTFRSSSKAQMIVSMWRYTGADGHRIRRATLVFVTIFFITWNDDQFLRAVRQPMITNFDCIECSAEHEEEDDDDVALVSEMAVVAVVVVDVENHVESRHDKVGDRPDTYKVHLYANDHCRGNI